MKNKIIIKNNLGKTTIVYKNNYVIRYIKNLTKNNNKIFCIVDLKLKKNLNKLNKIKNLNIIFIKSSEKIKNFNYYNKLCEMLLNKDIDRNSTIVAVGGGTIGDLTGFVASTILRGVKFILIPSTLLSQVDSAIGGKNGINSKFGKNLIGTFYQPSEILIDTNILNTLPKREMQSGYAEILKHSLIKDKNFFKWLEKNYKKIFNYNSKFIEYAVSKSISIKLSYVKKDPKEDLQNSNSRAMLNFGHTFGHSLETFYNYNNKLNHGEAISIGMVIESKISNKLGFLKDNELKRILFHFKQLGLKMYDINIKNQKIFKILLKDKKNIGNEINIVLLKKIGESFFARKLNISKIKSLLKNI